MECMMIIGFIILAAFLVYWVISSEMMENELERKDNYINALEEMNRIHRKWHSEKSSTEQWSD